MSGRAGSASVARRRRAEALLDVGDDGVDVDVADHDDGGVVGPVPVVVELPQLVARTLAIESVAPDRVAVLVRRAGEVHALGDLEQATVDGLRAAAPLVERRCPLGLDLGGSNVACDSHSRARSCRSSSESASLGTLSLYTVSSNDV